MFWLTKNNKINTQNLIKSYFLRTAGNSEKSLKYFYKELDNGFSLNCVCNFSEQLYEDKSYICFFSGYLSGKNITNNAKILVNLIDFSGNLIRFRKEIGGIFSGFLYMKELEKFIFFSSQGTPNYCYYSTDGFISISNKPLFAAIGSGEIRRNKQFLYENVACGYSLTNTTLFENVIRLKDHNVLIMNLSGDINLYPLIFPNTIQEDLRENDLKNNTALFSEYLLNALNPLKDILSRNKNSKIELRVSGGKDSRTILAALDALNIPYSPIIYGLGVDDESKVASKLLEFTRNNQKLIVDTPNFPDSYEKISENIDLMLLRMNGFIHVEARQSAYTYPVLSDTRNPIILGHAHLQRGGFARTMNNNKENILMTVNSFFTSPFVNDNVNKNNIQILSNTIALMGYRTYCEILYFINRLYRVTRYLESHYLHQSTIGIPYYPLIDQRMIYLLDTLPMHDKVSEKMVFSSIVSFNEAFSCIPLASKRWRFEANTDTQFYKGYNLRNPDNVHYFSEVSKVEGYIKNRINETRLSEEILDKIYSFIHSSIYYKEILSLLSYQGQKIICDKHYLLEQKGIERKVKFDFLWRIYILCKAYDLSWINL